MKKIYTLLIALFVFASFAFANVSWVGNSHIYIKLGSTETWYTGSDNFEQPAGYFHGAELGTFLKILKLVENYKYGKHKKPMHICIFQLMEKTQLK